MKQIITGLLIASISFFTISCLQEDTNKVRVAINTGPDELIWDEIIHVAKMTEGLDVEVVAYNNYIQPNEALQKKEVDANAFQSIPYLELQMQEHNYKFNIASKTFLFPLAAYSKKISDINELKEGALIAISNDANIRGRALLLLEKENLITLKDGVGFLARPKDILYNPKSLQFIEVDTPQLADKLNDPSISMAIINNNFSSQAGLLATRDGLILENKNSPYANVIVTRVDNMNDEKIQKLISVLHSKSIELKVKEVYKGDAIKAW
ncbi:MetQ/NlpA family lipoprotein [Proteus myxofaciens]|uniref:Lipoprotein n=1 Tax=Proteus myxofaciens ATCC 19692 TaxID=1354337 RepID=A0A198GQ84_9GAMM|nr:MetQ/NlpA family lipoprotein [Proteus myxofaciens]OAT39228.1 substrate-binding component of an ABC superfamily methionine transporter [Proteus myxofaciens ATCC 19692]